MSNIFLEFREFANLSQEKAAEKIGVTRNYYSMLENFKRKPSPGLADKFLTVAKSYEFPANYNKIYKDFLQKTN